MPDTDPVTTSAARTQARPRWRTNDLIERLRELDPTGERTVFLEIGREDSTDTDPLAAVYVEDGNAVWDSARLRIVLTNEEPTDA